MQPNSPLHNINTLRYFATLLLVAYHVIGTGEQGGMHYDYPSLWRIAADALIDVRMPLFAFIAGMVYALRPISATDVRAFFVGKFHRLVVPGVIASLVFWIGCNMLLHNGFAYGSDILSAVTLSMGHFWFLQAILLNFVIIGGLDAALKYRRAVQIFVGAIAMTFVWKLLGIPYFTYVQITNAVYLAPYFVLGILANRYHGIIITRHRALLLSAAGLFCLGVMLNVGIYQQTGALSHDRFDVQSLALGMGAIILAYFLFPKIHALDRLAIFSFTIYLYHPFGTSAVRRIFEGLELNAPGLHFVLGLTAGLVLPCVLHLAASRTGWSRQLLLGLRSNSSAPRIIRRSL